MEWYALAIALLVCFIATDALAKPVTAKLVTCEVKEDNVTIAIFSYADRNFLRIYHDGTCPLEITVQDDL